MTHLWSIPHVQDCLRLWLWCLPLLLKKVKYGLCFRKWASLRIARRILRYVSQQKGAKGEFIAFLCVWGGSLIPIHIRNEQLSSRSPYQNITSSLLQKYWTVPKKNTRHTVDGRNPAPVEGGSFVPLFTVQGLYIPGDCWGVLNHQQYESTCIRHNCCNCCIDPIHQ